MRKRKESAVVTKDLVKNFELPDGNSVHVLISFSSSNSCTYDFIWYLRRRTLHGFGREVHGQPLSDILFCYCTNGISKKLKA